MKYEIWSEGYHCSGMDFPAKAELVATVEADSFSAACIKHYGPDKKDFDPVRLTYWGCRLFDNEEGARQAFG